MSVISGHADEDPLVVPLGTDLVGEHGDGKFRRVLRYVSDAARSLFGWLATAALVLLMVFMTIRTATGPRIDGGHPTNTTNNYAVGAFVVLLCVLVAALVVIAACIAAPAPFVGVVWLLVLAVLVFCAFIVIPLMETYTPLQR